MTYNNKGKFLCGDYTFTMRGAGEAWGDGTLRIQKRQRYSCDMKGTCYHYDDTHAGKRIFYDDALDDYYVEIKIKEGGNLRVYWKDCERR